MCRKGACVVTTQTKARPDYNKETGLLRGLPKLSSFSREYTEYAGGRGGSMVAFKNVDYEYDYAFRLVKNQIF